MLRTGLAEPAQRLAEPVRPCQHQYTVNTKQIQELTELYGRGRYRFKLRVPLPVSPLNDILHRREAVSQLLHKPLEVADAVCCGDALDMPYGVDNLSCQRIFPKLLNVESCVLASDEKGVLQPLLDVRDPGQELQCYVETAPAGQQGVSACAALQA